MQPFTQLTLDTPRLHLRPLRESDADAMFALFSDPTVVRYLSHPPWTSITQAQTLIADDLRNLADGTYLRLGLESRASGRLIGNCSLFNLVPASQRADLGYVLAPDQEGQGLMHEALCALLDWGFNVLELRRLEADVDPRNGRSIKTVERLGFQREGFLRERWLVNGEIGDTLFYGLLKSDPRP